MSYGREYLADNAYEIEQTQKKWEDMCIRAANNAMHGLWIKKDGELIHVSNMETSHIQNCIKMLNRNDSPFKDVYIQMFERELKKRNDT